MTQVPPPPPPQAPLPGETAWYGLIGPQQVGPVPLTTIFYMIQNGTMNAGTMVWREGLATWTPAGTVPELAQACRISPWRDAGLGLTTTGLIIFIVLLFTCLPLCWLPWTIHGLRAR